MWCVDVMQYRHSEVILFNVIKYINECESSATSRLYGVNSVNFCTVYVVTVYTVVLY